MKKLSEQEITKIAYNCKKATYLIEKQQSGKITLREKFELELHLTGCEVCRIFQKQSSLINRFVKSLIQPERQGLKLEEGFKKVLQKRINEKLEKK
jgi:hypothetical protein